MGFALSAARKSRRKDWRRCRPRRSASIAPPINWYPDDIASLLNEMCEAEEKRRREPQSLGLTEEMVNEIKSKILGIRIAPAKSSSLSTPGGEEGKGEAGDSSEPRPNPPHPNPLPPKGG